jgi:hypothetical protein
VDYQCPIEEEDTCECPIEEEDTCGLSVSY